MKTMLALGIMMLCGCATQPNYQTPMQRAAVYQMIQSSTPRPYQLTLPQMQQAAPQRPAYYCAPVGIGAYCSPQ